MILQLCHSPYFTFSVIMVDGLMDKASDYRERDRGSIPRRGIYFTQVAYIFSQVRSQILLSQFSATRSN